MLQFYDGAGAVFGLDRGYEEEIRDIGASGGTGGRVTFGRVAHLHAGRLCIAGSA